MAKSKMTVTIDPAVLTDADADADAAGLNRSEYVEHVLRTEHYRRLIAQAAPRPPLSDTDEQGLRDLLSWQRNPWQAA